MMALTDTKVRGIRVTGERHEYPDRDGLVLRVSAKGMKSTLPVNAVCL